MGQIGAAGAQSARRGAILADRPPPDSRLGGACTYRIPAPLVEVGRPGPHGWEVMTEVSIDSDRFDELGHDFERDRPVVRGKVGTADVRLFPVADAVAYAERWLPVHRPREEEFSGPAHLGTRRRT